MKTPEQVFPQRKAAEFDATGRPYHSMFYTGKAHFFKLLFVSEIMFLVEIRIRIGFFFLCIGYCWAHEWIKRVWGSYDCEAYKIWSVVDNVSLNDLVFINYVKNVLFFSDLSGTQWMSKDELEIILMEEIADIEYGNFLTALNRLVALPYSYKVKEFIEKYRKPLMAQTNTNEVLKPQHDVQGRQFVTTYGKCGGPFNWAD